LDFLAEGDKLKLVDYSYARPDPAYIKAQGFGGVMRYLSPTPGKNLSAGERDALFAQGLGIGLVWESTANRDLSGNLAGENDAKAAIGQANSLGFTGAIYFAVDFDAAESDQAVIDSYFDGVNRIIDPNRVGGYGGYYVIKRLFDHGKIKWGWQTYAWSGGQWDPRAQIRQVKNGQWNDTVDFNETGSDNWGGQFKEGVNMGNRVIWDGNVEVILTQGQVDEMSSIFGLSHTYNGSESWGFVQECERAAQAKFTELANKPPIEVIKEVDSAETLKKLSDANTKVVEQAAEIDALKKAPKALQDVPTPTGDSWWVKLLKAFKILK
jgi:hypothetical protein